MEYYSAGVDKGAYLTRISAVVIAYNTTKVDAVLELTKTPLHWDGNVVYFRHLLHWKLLFWQFSAQLMTKIS